MIDIRSHVQEMIDWPPQSWYTLATTLHKLILADAFKIPNNRLWLWIEREERVGRSNAFACLQVDRGLALRSL